MHGVSEIYFRAAGTSRALDELLRDVLGELDQRACRAWQRRGEGQIDGRPVGALDQRVRAGERVHLDWPGRDPRVLPSQQSDHFVALVPAPIWPRGVLDLGRGKRSQQVAFEIREIKDGLAELLLSGAALVGRGLLEGLAQAGMPVLGDSWHGGILVAGGVRLRSPAGPLDADSEAGWWPAEPVFPPRVDRDGEPPRFRVSRATARVLARGHPWILPDDETDDAGRHRPGTLVRVVDPGGRVLGLARIEGSGRMAAPHVGCTRGGAGRSRQRQARSKARARTQPERARHRAPLHGGRSRASPAKPRGRPAWKSGSPVRWRSRRSLMRQGAARPERRGLVYTDALRLIHGEADGLPGLAVDRLGPLLRVLLSGRACEALVGRVVDALERCCAPELPTAPPVVQVLQLRDAPAGRLESVSLLRGTAESVTSAGAGGEGGLIVHERGLAFRVDPGLGAPFTPRPGVGLYLDQRENRERLVSHARRGGRWLNLFAHTGAFSLALLAAGAGEVVSVDLSAAWLRWLDENLTLNLDAGVDASRHRSIRRDGRRYLGELPESERFDGIVLDPPTAAAAGRRFWSVQRDLEPLIGEALARLAPGGVLLVCRNERGARRKLGEEVERAAASRRVRLRARRPAGPGADFPSLAGFPEGDSFVGVLAQRDD